MIETIGIILLNIGTGLGAWGLFWRLWDRRSFPAVLILVAALICAVIGEAMS